MAKVNLTCDTLGDLDGGMARSLIDREICRALGDCQDRGDEDGKARTVVIQLDMKNSKGSVGVQVKCKTKLPDFASNFTAGELRATAKGGDMLFQSKNPQRPDQPTFEVMDDGEIVNGGEQ